MKKFKKHAKIDVDKLTKLEKWLGFIDHTDEELIDMAVRTEEDIREAMKKYEELLQDDEMIRLYNYERDQRALQKQLIKDSREEGFEEGVKKGVEQGIKQGVEQGIQKSQIETAKNLLSKGIDVQIIADCIGLTIEKVKELQNELDKKG